MGHACRIRWVSVDWMPVVLMHDLHDEAFWSIHIVKTLNGNSVLVGFPTKMWGAGRRGRRGMRRELTRPSECLKSKRPTLGRIHQSTAVAPNIYFHGRLRTLPRVAVRCRYACAYLLQGSLGSVPLIAWRGKGGGAHMAQAAISRTRPFAAHSYILVQGVCENPFGARDGFLRCVNPLFFVSPRNQRTIGRACKRPQ